MKGVIIAVTVVIAILLFIGFTTWINLNASCESFKGVSIKEIPARCWSYYNYKEGQKQ